MGLEFLAANWLAIGFLSYKSVSVLEMPCICDLIERHQEVVMVVVEVEEEEEEE